MKKIIGISAILLFAVSGYSKELEKISKSKIKNVTVFLQGAQVERTANISIKKGITKIVMENVSPHLDQNSLQANGKGDFIILSTFKDVKYPEPKDASAVLSLNQKKIKILQDSLKWLNFDITDLSYKMGFLNSEKTLLMKNKIISGESKGDSLELFQQAMVYMRKQLFEINKELRKYRIEEMNLSEQKIAMNSRLVFLQNFETNQKVQNTTAPTHRVVITIQANKEVYGTLNVSYIVANAGWKPSYDIRAHNTNDPIELTYKAEVYQNSGVDWDNVALTLSSNSAYRTTAKPALPAWYLNYYNQTPYNYRFEDSKLMKEGAYNLKMTADETPSISKDLAKAKSSAYYSQMVTGKTNVEFELDLKYSIPTGQGGQLMAIHQKDLKSDYYHYLVPKLEKEAFLLARIDNWEDLNLLPAEASIFFEGTYVGKSMINPSIMQDTLEIALGRDDRVICKRELLKDKDKSKFIGNNKIKTYTYEIELRNNRSNSIKNLIVEDQIPVTKIDDIKINLLKKDGAKLNERTGRLTWEYTLDAKQAKIFQFSYTIKHDKDKLLSNN